ncbi:hypothetical protein HBE96_12255 [Clostridium sp. P21]|uniref:Uncharacterized protein n=1 Tax=Clostridium muellerianum TaxID=2716538 RepID=A0A7Y0HQ64_9CLOT|nr:hypothetical protein [Clostridium muellerianum]NMM63438.1 hypothetical protein [Clostridium muellerianum]
MENAENIENITIHAREPLVYQRSRRKRVALKSARDYLEFNELMKKELNTYGERRTSDVAELIMLVKNVLLMTSDDTNLEAISYSKNIIPIIDYSFNIEKTKLDLVLVKDSEICKKTIAFGKCSGTYICAHKIKNSNLLSIGIPYSNIPGYTIHIIY